MEFQNTDGFLLLKMLLLISLKYFNLSGVAKGGTEQFVFFGKSSFFKTNIFEIIRLFVTFGNCFYDFAEI